MKEVTKQQRSIDTLTEKGYVMEIFHDLKIMRLNDNVVAVYFRGSPKPSYHYKFDNNEKREKFITEKKDQELRTQEQNDLYLKKGSEVKAKYIPNIILCSSWGYEQTNVDFYVILERKNDMIVMQEIGKKYLINRNYDDRGECVPDASLLIGEPFRKKINKFGYIKIESYMSCSIWDGEPMYFSTYA